MSDGGAGSSRTCLTDVGDDSKKTKVTTMLNGKPDSFHELLRKQLETTTAHGLPRIQAADKPIRKLYWGLIVITGFGVFAWQSSEVISKFYAYNTTISIEMKFEKRLGFPAVTICNLNPVKMSALVQDPQLRSLVAPPPSPTRRRRNAGAPTTTAAQGKTPPQDEVTTTAPEETTIQYTNWDNTEVAFGEQDDGFQMVETVQTYLASLNYTDRAKYGHHINDFLYACSWKGYPCSPRNFTQSFNYMYGNCYTFNADKNAVLTQTKSGPLYGLSLELYIEGGEYVEDLQPSSGARVVLHSQGEMPFPEDEGFMAAPGFKTTIGLRMLEVNRMPHPYSKCVQEKIDAANIFTEFFDMEYSRKGCEKNCYNWAVQLNCNCTDFRYNYFNDYPVCDTTDESTADCINSVEYLYDRDQLNPPCPDTCSQPCSQKSYEATVSNVVWPNQQYKETLTEDLMQTTSDIRREVETQENFISDNMVKIDVYYTDLNYEFIQENIAYTEGDVVSNLGGQVGLWLGVSVMTCFEFFEFVYDVCVLFFVKLLRAPQRKKVSTPVIPLRHNNKLDNSGASKIEMDSSRNLAIYNQ